MNVLTLVHLPGTRIGRVKVVFKLPPEMRDPRTQRTLQTPLEWTKQGALAYVEWYAKLPAQADPVHMMYTVSKPPLRANGLPPNDIIPISIIRQSCQLVPCFPRSNDGTEPDGIPEDWNTNTVLDISQRFLLNNSASKYAYQTLW